MPCVFTQVGSAPAFWMAASSMVGTPGRRLLLMLLLAKIPIELSWVVNHDLLKGFGTYPFMGFGDECFKIRKLLMVGARPVASPQQCAGTQFP